VRALVAAVAVHCVVLYAVSSASQQIVLRSHASHMLRCVPQHCCACLVIGGLSCLSPSMHCLLCMKSKNLSRQRATHPCLYLSFVCWLIGLSTLQPWADVGPRLMSPVLSKSSLSHHGVPAGIPSMVYAHELTNTLMYAGPVTDMVAAISDLPAGGQVSPHNHSS
jgi:hypothetical protein